MIDDIISNNKIDAEKLWEVAWTYIKTVVDTLREPFLILDEQLKVVSANKTFYSFFQTNPDETEGEIVYNLGNGQWNIPNLKILLEDILPKNTFFEDFKVEHEFPKIGRRVILLNARRIYTKNNEKPILLLAMEDVTKQRMIEDQLKEYAKKLTLEVAKKTEELEKRIVELEKLNALMVDREIKMIELKTEIEKLKK